MQKSTNSIKNENTTNLAIKEGELPSKRKVLFTFGGVALSTYEAMLNHYGIK